MSSGNSIDVSNFKSTRAAVFFGVPNRGLSNAHLEAMVKGHPNAQLVADLGVDSSFLKKLHDQFCRTFNFSNSEILSCYETELSLTTVEVRMRRDFVKRKAEIRTECRRCLGSWREEGDAGRGGISDLQPPT